MMLQEQVVLLTGASQGIGKCVLEHLLNKGAMVLATDRTQAQLESSLKALTIKFPAQLHMKALDLSDISAVKAIVSQWSDRFQFDHFVNCAGVLHVGTLQDTSLTQMQHMMTINTLAPMVMMQSIAPQMKAKGKGSMVVIGSNAANTPRTGIGGYAASKSALHMLVRSMGIELASYGIRCNLVSPGSTRTDMQVQLWHEQYGEQEVIAGDLAQYRLGIPLQKMAEPEDIAKAVLFLISEDAGHITLHDLRVDGGATLDA